MDKKNLTGNVQKLLNGEITILQIEYGDNDSTRDIFLLKTVKRLVKAYSLYKRNKSYKEDYYLALRDYLLFFDVSIMIRNEEIPDNNAFGISYDIDNNRYYASLQSLNGINAKFIRDAFLRDVPEIEKKRNANLVTDPMIFVFF